MSSFALKMTAVISMLADHICCALYYGSIISYGRLYLAMRTVGRISFPLFCFQLVNGFSSTHDRRKYLSRLCLSAVISQIPYTLIFTPANYDAISADTEVYFAWKTAAALLVPFSVYFLNCPEKKPDASLLALSLALLLSCHEVKAYGYVILSGELNIFYTLAVSLAMLMGIEKLFSKRSGGTFDKLSMAVALITAFCVIQKKADYGYAGTLLVLMLYLSREKRDYQCYSLLLWGTVKYGIYAQMPIYLLGTAFSAIPIWLYNGQRGKRLKYFFYVIYPVHLLALFAGIELLTGGTP